MMDARTETRALVVLFAALYFVEGLCALSGLMRLPFDHFGKDVAGWSATRLSAVHVLLAVPWAIKPIFGALSDNVPLFGSRRRSYLIVANSVAAIACLALPLMASQGGAIACLLALSFGMAATSAVAGGLLVESGQRCGNANLLVTQQRLWYGVSNLCAQIAGGYVAGKFAAENRLRATALILVGPLIGVVVIVWALTPETPGCATRKSLRSSLNRMSRLMRSRQLLLVAAFLFLFAFNPGLETPLYFHVTGELGFSQQLVGTLNAVMAAGAIAGVLACRALSKQTSWRTMFYICVALGLVSTFATFAIHDRFNAFIVYFVFGLSAAFSLVTTTTLAAEACPEGQEGLCFAAMMSIENIASMSSDASGSYLFEAVFSRHLGPLIVLSAAVTACSAILVWLLPNRSSDEHVEGRP